jgi:hypothetical protein
MERPLSARSTCASPPTRARSLSRGVDARLLGSLRRVAEREIGVIDDLTSPLRQVGNDYSPEQVREITAEVAREVGALRNVLVERELTEYLNS